MFHCKESTGKNVQSRSIKTRATSKNIFKVRKKMPIIEYRMSHEFSSSNF